MLQEATSADRILDMVKANPDCTLEEVTQEFPDRHWSTVWIDVDRLRRLSRLRLIYNGYCTASLRLPSQ